MSVVENKHFIAQISTVIGRNWLQGETFVHGHHHRTKLTELFSVSPSSTGERGNQSQYSSLCLWEGSVSAPPALLASVRSLLRVGPYSVVLQWSPHLRQRTKTQRNTQACLNQRLLEIYPTHPCCCSPAKSKLTAHFYGKKTLAPESAPRLPFRVDIPSASAVLLLHSQFADIGSRSAATLEGGNNFLVPGCYQSHMCPFYLQALSPTVTHRSKCKTQICLRKLSLMENKNLWDCL